jgi:hypothetical protein
MQIKYALSLALTVAVTLVLFPLLGFGEEAQISASAKQQALHERAERGDAKAQYDLGLSYEYGFGEAQDYHEALRWYRKSAEQGFTDSRFALARMYFDGTGVIQDFTKAAHWYGCPNPAENILKGCKEISYADLPQAAADLLSEMKCKTSHNYDFGSALDLNGDGTPEYQICSADAPHGPCTAVVIGKIGSKWKSLSAGPSLGYAKACSEFVVLESQHEGFHDICLPSLCSPTSKNCIPTIWQFKNDHYRIIGPNSDVPSK